MRRTVTRTLLALTAGVALLLPSQGAVSPAAAAPKPANGGVANGLIAYGSSEQGHPGWVTIRPDGSDRTFHPLPDWAAEVNAVTWSPDGSELAISALLQEGGGFFPYSIVLGEPSGSGMYWQVTNWGAGSIVDDYDPAWSPSGRSLVFASSPSGGTTSTIYEVNAVGWNPVQLTASWGDRDPAYSVNWDLAFERDWSGVWILPGDGGPERVAVSSASAPSFSPDGTRLASRSSAGNVQVSDLDGTNAEVLTTGGAGNWPAWSPDGSTVALVDGSQLCLIPATGGTESCIDDLPAGPTGPSWQPVPVDPEPVVRVAGQTRLGTAIAVSKAGFDDGAAKAAVLARSDTFPDALAGTPLAVKKGGPLLLTTPTALDASVGAELTRVLGTRSGKTVYLLGGTGALAPAVDTAVKALGFTTVRLSGATRYDTAVAVANALGSPETLFLATGRNFPDALAAGTAAGSYWADPAWGGGAVLLTADRVLPAVVSAYLAGHPSAWVETVGGQAAAAYPSADEDLVGSDRYETAELVALSNFGAAAGAGVATGLNFPDALAGGVLLAVNNLPLLLTRPTGLPTSTDEYLSVFSGSVNVAFVFGGTAVIPSSIMSEVGNDIGLEWEPELVTASSAGVVANEAVTSLSVPDLAGKEHPGLTDFPASCPPRRPLGGASRDRERCCSAPEDPHPARLQVVRVVHDAAVRAGHHLRRRPERLREVQRGRRPGVGDG
ncbi:MAG: cell wall-binding repeat-containing protein [Actinomycetia bacterium]|nr:cell wall-binding repeat-containing protein [Actinomycetes bacterium]